MRNILEIFNTRCVGCGACHNICPVNAITMNMDKNGFYKPSINENICINCGACDRVCPILNPEYNNPEILKCYAIWADDAIRKQSSSGGAFTVLAEEVIRQGGVVFGAAWTDDFYVHAFSAKDSSGLEALRRSKYCQSDVGLAFRAVKELLTQQIPVFFVGTPCQVAGLTNYLHNTRTNAEKLITADFICYYNPSMGVVRRFLDDSFGLENLESFTFRDKTHGWISHAFRVKCKGVPGTVSKDGNNAFFRGYFNALYESDACTQCVFSGNSRQGDLTLADFWKIEEHDKSWNDGRGTSMVWINSEKGNVFFNTLLKQWKRCEEVPISWIRAGQKNAPKPHAGRDYFRELLPEKQFDTAVDFALNKKFDIGMVCVQSYENYGSALTNYALYKVLRDLRYSVQIITQPMSSVNKPTIPQNFESKPYPDYACAKSFPTKEEMSVLNESCGQFLVGSDQLFNYEIYKLIDGFIKLDWVDDKHKKMAYAASFGQDQLLGPMEERKVLSACLKRFHAFSVREASGVALANQLDTTAVQVLDPVFLCDMEHYKKLVNAATPLEPKRSYIFSYILDPTRGKEQAIRQCSKHLRKDIFAVSDRWRSTANLAELWGLETKVRLSNEQWISALYHSDFVITDSFHGMCFAIIFHKPFIAIANKMRGTTRFYSILKMLGLEACCVESEDEIINNTKKLLKPIDYAAVEEILKYERAKGFAWMQENLDPPAGFRPREEIIQPAKEDVPTSPMQAQPQKRWWHFISRRKHGN